MNLEVANCDKLEGLQKRQLFNLEELLISYWQK